MNSLDFSQEDVRRAAGYHRPAYVSFAVGLGLLCAEYAALQWSEPGRWLWEQVDGLGWAGTAAAWAAIIVTVSDLVRLPLAWWRGFLRERRFGFSTQDFGAWLVDRAKGWAVAVALAAAAWTAAVGLARALPGWWVVPVALLFALAVLFLSFVAPVVLEPLFNRFRPLSDARLADDLRTLADRAGVPVREVLVADASRRTTKVNAYVSGLGGTRRVVLFDTLLASAGEPEVNVIVAHELGHRRYRHVVQGTMLGMVGAIVAVVVLWALLGTRMASPRELPAALLILTALQVLALAPGAALSRRWERAADRFSVELTRDLPAYERAHIELAKKNLSDLDPPRIVYLLLFGHPTPPERLALGRAVNIET